MWKLSADTMFCSSVTQHNSSWKHISPDSNGFQTQTDSSSCISPARPTVRPWDWIRPGPLCCCHGDPDTSTDEARATQDRAADQKVCESVWQCTWVCVSCNHSEEVCVCRYHSVRNRLESVAPFWFIHPDFSRFNIIHYCLIKTHFIHIMSFKTVLL